MPRKQPTGMTTKLIAGLFHCSLCNSFEVLASLHLLWLNRRGRPYISPIPWQHLDPDNLTLLFAPRLSHQSNQSESRPNVGRRGVLSSRFIPSISGQNMRDNSCVLQRSCMPNPSTLLPPPRIAILGIRVVSFTILKKSLFRRRFSNSLHFSRSLAPCLPTSRAFRLSIS